MLVLGCNKSTQHTQVNTAGLQLLQNPDMSVYDVGADRFTFYHFGDVYPLIFL